ncbi:MAG: EamA family transporter [Gammaproteobacteria bacterium]
MRPWLLYSAAALGFWGVWGALGKLAARTLAPPSLMLLAYAGIVAVFPLLLVLFWRSFAPRWDSIDNVYAIASGVFAGLGFLCFYLALTTGEVARVVVITATYPIVTVLIAVLLLGEPMSLRMLLGTTLAIAGILILAT